MAVRDPQDELQDFFRANTGQLTADLNALIRSRFSSDLDAHRAALDALGETLRKSQAVADMYGRRRLYLEANAVHNAHGFSPTIILRQMDPEPIPRVPFEEAIQDLADRLPVGIDSDLISSLDASSAADAVSRVYNESHGFALARVADKTLSDRINREIQKGQRTGMPIKDAGELISRLIDSTEAYGRTVYRTNLSTAYEAGREAAARDEVIRQVAPVMMFNTAGDADVRPGHRAMDGVIGAVDDPIWKKYAPPLSYNCRCSRRLLGWTEAKRRGAIGKNGVVLKAREPAGIVIGPDAIHPRFVGSNAPGNL